MSMFTVIGDDWYFVSRGERATAIVDQHEVVEVVFETRMPDTDSLTVDAAGARSAAEAYVEQGGYVASGDLARYQESTKEIHQAGVALIDVTFSPPDAAMTPLPGAVGAQGWWHDLEVLVNGSNGQVFALVDHANAWGKGVLAPVLGKGRAVELAQSAASGPVLALRSAYLCLQCAVSTERSSSYWEVLLGSAGSSAPATDAARVTVDVDANSGEANVQP
jgi:hypothetical protein